MFCTGVKSPLTRHRGCRRQELAVEKCGGLARQRMTEWGSVAMQEIQFGRQEGLIHFCLGSSEMQQIPFGRRATILGVCLPKNCLKYTANQKGGLGSVHCAAYSEKLSGGNRPRKVSLFFDVRVDVADPVGAWIYLTRYLWFSYLTLLFVTVLTQALLALVGSNLVSFTFFSARHTASKVMSYEL